MNRFPRATLPALALCAFLLASCIPNEPTGVWGFYPSAGAIGVNSTGVEPGVVVVGDSLVYLLPPQDLADLIRFWTGTNAVVAAAGGASTAHFTKSSLMSPAGLATLKDYVSFLRPRTTVIALGSNDARILEAQNGQSGGYTFDEYIASLDLLVAQGLRNDGCAVIVNVAEHWGNERLPYIQLVNAWIDAKVAQSPRVYLANWKGASAGQDFFSGSNDIHHSPAGAVAYRDLIVGATISAHAAGCGL